jgi:prepilin-type N-terminal cleavage/methylation domain-containing protein
VLSARLDSALRAARHGYTIIEILAALVLSAIVIAAVGGLAFRQQRFNRDVIGATERLEQLEQAAGLMPIALRSISPGEGDIPPGGARDTSLEFRATISAGVICDSSRGSLVLAPANTDPPRLASILSRPDIGDTLWSLGLTGSAETWTPRAITAVIDSTTTCLLGGTSPWANATRTISLVIRVTGQLPGGSGTPVRITRPWRYSIYHSSDGDWYLGAREWNSSSMKFNTIQPVSGPFVSPASGGVAFRYFDTSGAVVPSGMATTHGIALVQVSFRVDSTLPGTYRHAIGVIASTTLKIAVRNRVR